MKHIIDIKTWERKENYEFFLGFQNPTISITSEVECSGARTRAKPPENPSSCTTFMPCCVLSMKSKSSDSALILKDG